MQITHIKNSILSMPTIISYHQEIIIIKALMKQPNHILIKNKEKIIFIINVLELSHADSGIFELTRDDEFIFLTFRDWLAEINISLDLHLNSSVINTFGLTCYDINKMMSK